MILFNILLFLYFFLCILNRFRSFYRPTLFHCFWYHCFTWECWLDCGKVRPVANHQLNQGKTNCRFLWLIINHRNENLYFGIFFLVSRNFVFLLALVFRDKCFLFSFWRKQNITIRTTKKAQYNNLLIIIIKKNC